jgi:hypothetical protein
MMPNTKDVDRRKAAALAAIKRALDSDEGEFSVALFVSHHLDELDAAYWKKHAGTPRPSPKKVLDLLVLRSHWGEEGDDGLDVFDFTLPDEVTDYVISVRFDENGDVGSIELES